mmetsp:Transcript_5813/g.10448  ORF Transcript_5813/g.10448 Transcript_5813/m.10448 type:complete len:200 (-) Transcript_5813:718-1317(-)
MESRSFRISSLVTAFAWEALAPFSRRGPWWKSKPCTRYFCLFEYVSSKPAKTSCPVRLAFSSRCPKRRSTSSTSKVSMIFTFGIAKSSVHPRFVPRSSSPYPTNHKSGRFRTPMMSASGHSRCRSLLKRHTVNTSFSVCVADSLERKNCFISCMVLPLSSSSSINTTLCGAFVVVSQNLELATSGPLISTEPDCERFSL